MPSPFDMLTLPFRVARTMVDFASGGDRVDVHASHVVEGNDPRAFTSQFKKDPTAISPLATGAHFDGTTARGRPFPGGPEIGVTVVGQRDGFTRDGRRMSELKVEYSGDFAGPGRITAIARKGGGLEINDDWDDVHNHSLLPARAAEIGHPVVSGIGFAEIARRARGG
jgi:hypothetical protein